MSPEQVEGSRHADARSDVFSMGVTLHAMLVGRAPFAHLRSVVQLLYTIVNVPPPPLSNASPWVPAGVASVVDRALAHDPGARFSDAREMLEALANALPDGGPLREEMLVAGEAGPYLPQTIDTAGTADAAVSTTCRETPARSLWSRLRGR
jgi:serine/threonine-protein kinase